MVAAPLFPRAWRFIQACGARLALRWGQLRRSCASDGLAVHRAMSLRLRLPLAAPPPLCRAKPLE